MSTTKFHLFDGFLQNESKRKTDEKENDVKRIAKKQFFKSNISQ